jgi:hypothetical protein
MGALASLPGAIAAAGMLLIAAAIIVAASLAITPLRMLHRAGAAQTGSSGPPRAMAPAGPVAPAGLVARASVPRPDGALPGGGQPVLAAGHPPRALVPPRCHWWPSRPPRWR